MACSVSEVALALTCSVVALALTCSVVRLACWVLRACCITLAVVLVIFLVSIEDGIVGIDIVGRLTIAEASGIFIVRILYNEIFRMSIRPRTKTKVAIVHILFT